MRPGAMMSEGALNEGAGPCRPRRRLDLTITPFATECGMRVGLMSRIFTITHSRNRHQPDRIAMGFPDISHDDAGDRISLFGAETAISDMASRIREGIAQGALIISETDAAQSGELRAFFRNRRPERLTEGFLKREHQRGGRVEKAFRERPVKKNVFFGPHIWVVPESGQGWSLNLAVSDEVAGDVKEELLVNTYGLSTRAAPARLPA